jgi:hypothetical protein
MKHWLAIKYGYIYDPLLTFTNADIPPIQVLGVVQIFL